MSDSEDNFLTEALAEAINDDLAHNRKIEAPAVKPAPAKRSPLDEGKAKVANCDSFRALRSLAGDLNDVGTVDGRWFKGLDKATSDAIRLAWRDRRDTLVRAMIAWWISAWHMVAEAINRPTAHTIMPASETSTIEAALGVVATDAQTGAVSGSLHQGSMAGVGFTTAEGYVTALANGVKAATAESYKQTLRNRYHFTSAQIGALTVTILPEAAPNTRPALPHEITHVTHTGPDIFEQKKAERAEKRLLQLKTTTKAEVQALLKASELIGVAVGEGAFLQLSWQGGGQLTLGRLREVLTSIGREAITPGAPSAEYHAGKAVTALKTREVDTTRLPNNELPETVAARWIAGKKLAGKIAATPGEAYGTVLLTVDLLKNGQLDVNGDADLAEAVKSHFATATGKELLKSDKMTAWFGQVLRKEHFAVKRGANYYVPGGQAEAARALSEAIEKVWGSHDQNEMTTGAGVIKSIGKGVAAEVEAFAKQVLDAKEQAKERARKAAAEEGLGEAEQTLAAERAKIGPRAAVGLIKDWAETHAKVKGYEALLGVDTTNPLIAQLAALRTQLEADDSSLRAAMLELS